MTTSSTPLDISKTSDHIGLVSTFGGVVTLDVPFVPLKQQGTTKTHYCTHLLVGAGGDVLVEMEDGSINPYLGVLDGSFIVCKGVRVLSSYSTYSTTATNITWHGGQ